jgi:hypothetical protein
MASIIQGNEYKYNFFFTHIFILKGFFLFLIEKEIIEVLLKNAKKEVKQIMEIAVVVKFIHEDNNAITSLCSMYYI